MKSSYEFLTHILDSMTEHVVVIDAVGKIHFVNKNWLAYGSNNNCTVTADWSEVNYLEECDKALVMGDNFGSKAGAGIRSVIEQDEPFFYLEYPCHSPKEQRWFMMRVSSFEMQGDNFYVISHQNITERKLAEEEVMRLARMDGLTNIPNRRTFDEFLHEEWKRCVRLKKTICLAIIDLDHFKLLNDTYGHQLGDECLIRIAGLLGEFVARPGDICARYGGEEFALVWSDTSLQQAELLSKNLLKKIINLNIYNKNSPVETYLTASIGLAGMVPNRDSDEKELINKADNMLYQAKDRGRNRVES
jgi:diguanylate cyclase (GGDEF)-like protein